MQILSPKLLADATDQSIAKGLPTGCSNVNGDITYHMSFWHHPYRSLNGQLYYIPMMRGYGGNFLLLLPNGLSGFRFANDKILDSGKPYDELSFIRLADRIKAFN